MTYSQARLYLGVSGVGFIVVLSALFIILNISVLLFPLIQQPLWVEIKFISLFLLCMVILLFPFDLLGGFYLPKKFQVSPLSFKRFFINWSKGVFIQSTLYAIFGLLILNFFRESGFWGALGAFSAGLIILTGFQHKLASFIAPISVSEVDLDRTTNQRIKWVKTKEPAFTGGISGLPGFETVILPANWKQNFSENTIEMLKTKRLNAILSGIRNRGLIISLGFSLAGFLTVMALLNFELSSVAQLVQFSLLYTLWSFIGLLILPVLNQQGVYESDRKLLEANYSLENIETALNEYDQFQNELKQKNKPVQHIFYPVPSVASRLEQLKTKSIRPGFWQAARHGLFLSWAGLGLLARNVHCNVGKPELWVFLPSD